MYACAAFRSVEDKASLGARVVGDLGSLFRQNCRVGLARCDHRDSARRQQRTQPDTHRQCGSLLHLAICQPAGRVVAAMRRVQHHHKSGYRGTAEQAARRHLKRLLKLQQMPRSPKAMGAATTPTYSSA